MYIYAELLLSNLNLISWSLTAKCHPIYFGLICYRVLWKYGEDWVNGLVALVITKPLIEYKSIFSTQCLGKILCIIYVFMFGGYNFG